MQFRERNGYVYWDREARPIGNEAKSTLKEVIKPYKLDAGCVHLGSVSRDGEVAIVLLICIFSVLWGGKMSCCASPGPPKHRRAPQNSASEMSLYEFNNMYPKGFKRHAREKGGRHREEKLTWWLKSKRARPYVRSRRSLKGTPRLWTWSISGIMKKSMARYSKPCTTRTTSCAMKNPLFQLDGFCARTKWRNAVCCPLYCGSLTILSVLPRYPRIFPLKISIRDLWSLKLFV